MILLIGPAVALVGLVAVFFVMRHKSVEKRSMYSARRSQIEHKVRAARQRTLAPLKHAEKASQVGADEAASASSPALTYEPLAYGGPPVAAPPAKTPESAPADPVWDAGPTAPAPPAPSAPADSVWDAGPAAPAPTFTPPEPSKPSFTPPAPAYQAPAPVYEPPPPAPEPPPQEAPAPEPVWTPMPPTPERAQPEMAEPARPEMAEAARPEPAAPAPAEAAPTSAGGGASWSVVGETKAAAEPEPAAKKKKFKSDAQTGAWSLASGEVAGDEGDEGPKKPSAALAIAQYAVLVVGLVMVLIGVVVMVANSHVT